LDRGKYENNLTMDLSGLPQTGKYIIGQLLYQPVDNWILDIRQITYFSIKHVGFV